MMTKTMIAALAIATMTTAMNLSSDAEEIELAQIEIEANDWLDA